MLALLDRYEFLVEYKGGYRQFRAKTIVVTSINHPDSMYANTGECRNQLARRLTSVTDVFQKSGVILYPPTKVVRRGRAVKPSARMPYSPFPGPPARGGSLGAVFFVGAPLHIGLASSSRRLCVARRGTKNTRGSPSAWRTLITCWPRSASPLGLDYAVEKTELYVQFQGDLYIAREYATGNNVNSTNNPFPAKSWVGCEIRLKIRC